MRKLAPLFFAAALCLAPRAARAGGMLEASLGLGWETSPDVQRMPTNIMLAPGYTFADDIVRLELGLVGDLGDVENSKFDLELRPMVLVKPPLFPLYGRAFAGVSGLVEKPTALTYGAALGVRMGALGVGAFLEAGALRRRVKIADVNKDTWIAEGRLGVYWD